MSNVVNKISRKKISCPQCGAPLYKVHRNFLYSVINLFVHIRRYKCVNKECRLSKLNVSKRQLSVRNPFKPFNPLKNKLNMLILILLIMVFWSYIINSYIINLGITKYTEG